MNGNYVVYKYGFAGKFEELENLKNWTEIVKYISKNKKSDKHFEIYQDGFLLLNVGGKIQKNS